MLRILIITAAFPPVRSGGADFALRLAEELCSAGKTVEVLTSDQSHTSSTAKDFKVKATIKAWTWSCYFECLNEIKEFRPDVVNLHFAAWTYHDHPAITFLPTVIKYFFPRLRCVTLIESLGGVRRELNSLQTNLQRKCISLGAGGIDSSYDYGTMLRDSDWLVTLSERDRDALGAYSSRVPEKCSVLPPPPIMPIAATLSKEDRSRLLSEISHGNEDKLIAFYGYKYPGKGLETLFKALRILKDSGVKFRLHIIGDYPDQYVLKRADHHDYPAQLDKLASELEIADLISEHGYADSRSLRPSQLLHAADVAVLPFDDGLLSHNSSYWFIAAHAVPVVATSAPGAVPALAREPITFCLAKDPQSMADALEAALKAAPTPGPATTANHDRAAESKSIWQKQIREYLAAFATK